MQEEYMPPPHHAHIKRPLSAGPNELAGQYAYGRHFENLAGQTEYKAIAEAQVPETVAAREAHYAELLDQMAAGRELSPINPADLTKDQRATLRRAETAKQRLTACFMPFITDKVQDALQQYDIYDDPAGEHAEAADRVQNGLCAVFRAASAYNTTTRKQTFHEYAHGNIVRSIRDTTALVVPGFSEVPGAQLPLIDRQQWSELYASDEVNLPPGYQIQYTVSLNTISYPYAAPEEVSDDRDIPPPLMVGEVLAQDSRFEPEDNFFRKSLVQQVAYFSQKLTPKQRELAGYMQRGLTTAEMAAAAGTTTKAIQQLRTRTAAILGKMFLSDELLAYTQDIEGMPAYATHMVAGDRLRTTSRRYSA